MLTQLCVKIGLLLDHLRALGREVVLLEQESLQEVDSEAFRDHSHRSDEHQGELERS